MLICAALSFHKHPEDQRLIYSGKLLLDHQCLRDLLPKVSLNILTFECFWALTRLNSGPKVPPYYFQQETRHVLHLVCSVKGPSKMPEASAKVCLLFHDDSSSYHSDSQGQNKGSWIKLLSLFIIQYFVSSPVRIRNKKLLSIQVRVHYNSSRLFH